VREWLAAQAAAGYVEYDAAAERFHMTEEQVFALATEGIHPRGLPGRAGGAEGGAQAREGVPHRPGLRLA
jgi:hypothetical protein